MQIQPQLDTRITMSIPVEIYRVTVFVIVAIITSRIAIYIGRVVVIFIIIMVMIIVAMVM